MTIHWTDEERTALSTIFVGGRSEVDPFSVVDQIIERRLSSSQMIAWEEGWIAGNDYGLAERLQAETGGEIDTRQQPKNPYGA